MALSGSRKCGSWGLRDNANSAAQDADALIQGEKETKAGLYSRHCYGPQTDKGFDQCTIFRESHIGSKIERHQECPFVNSTYCATTGFTAVRFNTGRTTATKIGLNVKKSPAFSRSTMCVPLNLKAGFAQKVSNDPGNWGYDLGSVGSDEYSSNYTFEQWGDPFDFDVRAYTMSTYVHFYSKDDTQNYWKPIPALDLRPELSADSKPYALTLMFINSCRIFYKEDSDDAIFPADARFGDTELWTNQDSRAHPLACIDWIEVCPHNEPCSAIQDAGESDEKSDVFVRYAMNKSTTFDAVIFRGASGLDAQTKIQDDTSLPLSKEPPQWIEESWALFNTSLARIQYDALDIANGTGRDKHPMYEPKMPAKLRDMMCGITMFQLPKEYNNVSVVPTICILLVPFVFWLMGVEIEVDDEKVEFSQQKKDSGFFHKLHLIRIEWFVDWTSSKLSKSSNLSTSSTGRPSSIAGGFGVSSNRPHDSATPSNYGTTGGTGQQQNSNAVQVTGTSAPATAATPAASAISAATSTAIAPSTAPASSPAGGSQLNPPRRPQPAASSSSSNAALTP